MPRERRLSGKSREAVETNARIEKLLLGIHEAVKSLSTRPGGFDAEAVKCQYQGSLETRMTLLSLLDCYIEGLRSLTWLNRLAYIAVDREILSLYNRTDDPQPVFPLGPRDGIWHDIHQLGIIVGIRENLSYHQSRHSFGTLAISAGLSIESIAKMMGHANISTTQGYA